MISTRMEYEVPFFDVDAYRIVWHGHYPKYFEMARCKLLEKIGCPYEVMEEKGYFFPVVDLQTKYIKPLLFKQKVIVTAELVEWENRLKIRYLITDAVSEERLTKASTTQMAILMPDQVSQYVSPQFLLEAVAKWSDI